MRGQVLVVLGVLAVLPGMLFAGGQQEVVEDGPVTLEMWAWDGSIDEEAVREYDEMNPDVSVNLRLIEQGDLHENLLTSFVGGSGAPDIAAIEIMYMQRFLASPTNFVNLYEVGAVDVEGDYLDWKFDQAKTPAGDVVIGLPIDIGPMAMAYRVDVLEEAGLPTDPEEVAALISTWDDFLELGRRIEAETGTPLVTTLKQVFDAVDNQGPRRYLDENNELIVDSNEQVQRAWDIAVAAHESGLSANISPWTSDWAAGHNQGAFAFEFAPSWMVRYLRENSPDAEGQWAIVETVPEGGGNWGGSFLGIPAQTDHPEAAYAMIEWLLAPEQQITMFQREALFPSTPSIFDEPAMADWTDDFFATPNIGPIYAVAAERVIPQYLGPDHTVVNDQIETALGRIEDGVQQPDAAWDEAIREAERQMSR